LYNVSGKGSDEDLSVRRAAERFETMRVSVCHYAERIPHWGISLWRVRLLSLGAYWESFVCLSKVFWAVKSCSR
jgi:hypothetical protein